MTDYYFYPYKALTGGGDGALDSLDGSLLKEGDAAFVVISSSGMAYTYYLDEDSAATESSPDVISPDANAGDKRWVLATIASDVESSGVNFLQGGTGAVERTAQNKMRDFVSVIDFGAVADDSTDCAAAFAACYTYAQSVGAAMYIPGGTYKLETKFTISHSDIRVLAGGDVVLHFTGTGAAVEIDGGAASSIYNVEFGGAYPIEIQGSADCTDALYMRAAHHCRIKAKARDCVTGLHVYWSVASEFWFTCSSNQGAFAALTPTDGIVLEDRDAGEYCADCTFHNPIIEGVSTSGIELANASGCLFRGGTSEGNGRGVDIADGCDRNTFDGMWCEANTVDDVEINGSHNLFINLMASSNAPSADNVEVVTGEHNVFIGGYIRTAECAAGSSNSVFIGVETSDNGSLGIKGAGTYYTLYCHESDTNGDITAKVPDKVDSDSGTWTPSLASTGGGSQGNANTAVGTYTKLGNMCFVQGSVNIAKGNLAAGSLSLSGLPFTSRNTASAFQYLQIGQYSGVALGANYTGLSLRISVNGNNAAMLQHGNNVASANIAIADCSDPVDFYFSGTYETT